MAKPLISVIICFLNPGRWLQESIDSVVKQSYIEWELILIDDGSNQSDSHIAQNMANRYPAKIFYADHENHANLGLTASRNVGIKKANGDYIAFLDADDYWYEDKLSKQLHLFYLNPAATVICEASRFWYSWENEMCDDPVVLIGAPEGLYKPNTLNKLLYPLNNGQPPCPTGIIAKKEVFFRSGKFEESFRGVYQLYEDQAFLAKVYINENIYISADFNNKYRKRKDSMSAAANDPAIYSKVRNFFLDWLKSYVAINCINDAILDEMITNAYLSTDVSTRV